MTRRYVPLELRRTAVSASAWDNAERARLYATVARLERRLRVQHIAMSAKVRRYKRQLEGRGW